MPFSGTHWGQRRLRSGMELFHSPDMNWPNFNSQRSIARERPWPDPLCWRTASRQQHSTSYPSLSFRLQFLHQLRATWPRVPDRAPPNPSDKPRSGVSGAGPRAGFAGGCSRQSSAGLQATQRLNVGCSPGPGRLSREVRSVRRPTYLLDEETMEQYRITLFPEVRL
jgi:hypothetical protein